MNIIIPSKRQLRYFSRAAYVATLSNHEKPMGCVIVCGNYVVSEGKNQSKSHTIQFRNDRKVNYWTDKGNLHAEIDALIKSKQFDLGDCEVFLYREDKHGNLANSRPCISCMPALKKAGLRHVYYTSKEGHYCYERIA